MQKTFNKNMKIELSMRKLMHHLEIPHFFIRDLQRDPFLKFLTSDGKVPKFLWNRFQFWNCFFKIRRFQFQFRNRFFNFGGSSSSSGTAFLILAVPVPVLELLFLILAVPVPVLEPVPNRFQFQNFFSYFNEKKIYFFHK
uniref:Uncharacterized protein n=1 Tax=Meloidogyne enterolobii TaxID=390850 RepID=A0A6V7UHA3_MELEN|nr:unnamed protein product [Meloidogyne enterolobii]